MNKEWILCGDLPKIATVIGLYLSCGLRDSWNAVVCFWTTSSTSHQVKRLHPLDTIFSFTTFSDPRNRTAPQKEAHVVRNDVGGHYLWHSWQKMHASVWPALGPLSWQIPLGPWWKCCHTSGHGGWWEVRGYEGNGAPWGFGDTSSSALLSSSPWTSSGNWKRNDLKLKYFHGVPITRVSWMKGGKIIHQTLCNSIGL